VQGGEKGKMKGKIRFAIEGPGGCRSFAIESTLQKPAQDVKLVESQRNVVSFPGPEKYRHIPSTPKEELERAKGLLAFFKPGMPELTVGDLSVVKAQRGSPEQVRQRLRAIRDGLTVGDLSAATDARERDAGKGLDELFVGGKKVESNPLTESQRLNAERIKKAKEAAELRFRLENPSVQDRE